MATDRTVRCPKCEGQRLKRTKPVVIFGEVPMMCLLCDHRFNVPKSEWDRRKFKRHG